MADQRRERGREGAAGSGQPAASAGSEEPAEWPDAELAVHAVMGLMREGAAMLDGDGRVLHCNSSLGEMLRRPVQQLVGQSFESFVHPADLEKWQAAFSRRSGEVPLGFTIDVLAAGDQTLPVHVAICQLQQAAGTIAFLVASDLAWQEKRLRQLERINAELESQRESLEIAATTDSMTGALTSGALIDVLRTELGYGCRYGSPVSLLLFDIDYFKPLNDSYGHAFGDRVLRELCDRCREAIRATDYLVRCGGDEFAAILPQTDARGARAVGQRIVDWVRQEPFDRGRREVPVTVSLGVATAGPEEGLTAGELMKRADNALYTEKRAGRNGQAVWGEEYSGPDSPPQA